MLEAGRPSVHICGTPPSGPVVDTTGAGDAFVGSLAYCLACLPELAVGEAVSTGSAFSPDLLLFLLLQVRRSCSLATLTVQRKGTQASYPGREEVEHLLARE